MKRQRLEEILDLIVVVLASAYCLVDSLNGWMLHNNISLPLSLSQLYKFPLILVIASRMILGKGKGSAYTLIALASFFAFLWIHTSTQAFAELMEDLTIGLKVLLFVLSFLFFRQLAIDKPSFFQKWFNRILWLNFVVLAGNIALGAAGFGYEQYYGGIGSVGYFYAGNEVSALQLFMATFLLAKAWQKGLVFYLFASIVLFLLAVSSATKVAMLGMVILFIAIPLMSERKRLAVLDGRKLRFIAAGLVGGILIVLFLPSLLREVGLMSRWEFWYKKYDNQLLTLILSGRDIVFGQSLKVLSSNYEPWEYIFGKGYSAFVFHLSHYTLHDISVEMDPADVFYSYGLIGLFGLYGFYFFQLGEGIVRIPDNQYPYAPYSTIFLLVIIGVGIISGHVIFSGLGAMFNGLGIAAIYYKSETEQSL
jgi:hypothetical protein